MIRYAEFGKRLMGGPPLILPVPEAANQTFIAGDFVYRVSGYLTICGADPAMILGLAMEPAHDDASPGLHTIDVLCFTEDTGIEMSVYHATPGNNVIEAVDHGKAYEIAVSDNKWFVDKGFTSAVRVRVHEFVDPLGTLEGRVLVTVLPTYREIA